MRAIFLGLLSLMSLLAGESPRTGTYTAAFTERHPESDYLRMRVRYNWPEQPSDGGVYDIAQEEFEIHVPSSYDGSEAYGLIVYTNAGKGGHAGLYRSVIDKHRLIWVAATNVPNERNVIPRWGLMLDAVWNMSKGYRIDQRRIYASGMSGGGRCASMVAPTYADVFSGAIYLVGCNPPVWPPEKAVGKPIRELAMANRYALMTGDGDFNKPETKALSTAMKAQGFKHVEYFEQQGLGHSHPSAEWFDKALQFVDQPLRDEAARLLAQAKALESKKPYDSCRILMRLPVEFPIATEVVTEAKLRLATLVPTVDAGLREEFAKLTTASADKQRAFTVRTAGFPCATEARALAEASGDKELAAMQAAPAGASASKLVKFQEIWAGFSCAGKAAEAYDVLAAKALEPLTAQDAGKRGKGLVKFLKDWQPCPSRLRAEGLLESDLAAELATILAIEKTQSRIGKLQQFTKAWSGTRAASTAAAELGKLGGSPGSK